MSDCLGELRVWWVPQVPMKPFYVKVESPEEGKKVLDILANYDLFQLENRIKPDYSNMGGLEEFTEDGWVEWESEEGDNIDEWAELELEKEQELSEELAFQDRGEVPEVGA